MNEMIKRRKDEGFTLIELMIVIAVIGILAVVLVPRVGGIKTAAKSAGIDTNIRAVQAYAESRITSWDNANTPAATIVTDITNAFTGTAVELTNPLTGVAGVTALTGGAAVPADPIAGQIAVVVTAAGGPVTIYAYDNSKVLMTDKTVTVSP